MIDKNEWLVVGIITSPHGINGKLKVKSQSDFEERFTKPGKRWIQKDDRIPEEIDLLSGFRQPGKESFIVSFKGINNRNEATQLKDLKILVKANDLPTLNKEEYHLKQLINLDVKISENNELKIIGKVLNIDNEKNNLLVVLLLKNNKKVLIPFVNEIVPIINIEKNFLIIDPPKGLLELEF